MKKKHIMINFIIELIVAQGAAHYVKNNLVECKLPHFGVFKMYADIHFFRITFANIQGNKKGNSPDAANLDKILRRKRVFTSNFESSIT